VSDLIKVHSGTQICRIKPLELFGDCGQRGREEQPPLSNTSRTISYSTHRKYCDFSNKTVTLKVLLQCS